MSGKYPVVLKVNEDGEENRYEKIHENLPQPPFLCLIIGSVKSGKTNYLINALRNGEDFYGEEYWSRYKIISNTLMNDKKGKYYIDAFNDCEDHYNDSMIRDIVEHQKKYDRGEAPTTLILLDDILSKDFKKNNEINFLASKFRHYDLSIFLTTQSFRAVGTIIRNNATNILIFKQQNNKELEKISEEYGELCSGEKIFMKYYSEAMKEPYSLLYIDAQSNPAKFFVRHERLIGEGDKPLF